jgi:hypothetical protein
MTHYAWITVFVALVLPLLVGVAVMIIEGRQRRRGSLHRICLPAKSEAGREVAYFRDFGEVGLARQFSQASHRINLLTVSLDPFVRHDAALSAAVARGVSVKVLTLDPEGVSVGYPAALIGVDLEYFRQQLRASLRFLAAKAQRDHRSASARLELRTYDTMPTQVSVAIDDNIYVSPLLLASRSRPTPIFKTSASTPGVGEAFDVEFNTLWTKAKELSSDH